MTQLFVPILAVFAAGVTAHLLFTRLISNANFVRNGYVFLLLGGIFLAPFIWPSGAMPVLFGYLQLVILWNLYTIFFINLMNSVSLRIMREIDDTPSRFLTTDQLAAMYSDEEALESRLRGLTAHGFLRQDGEELVLTAKGTVFATLLNLIRKLFGIEFYG